MRWTPRCLPICRPGSASELPLLLLSDNKVEEMEGGAGPYPSLGNLNILYNILLPLLSVSSFLLFSLENSTFTDSI